VVAKAGEADERGGHGAPRQMQGVTSRGQSQRLLAQRDQTASRKQTFRVRRPKGGIIGDSEVERSD